jgi:YfiR/HmsC-like
MRPCSAQILTYHPMSISAKRRGADAAGRAATLILVMLSLVGLPARAQALREYDVKAAFLYNFITFITWPAEAFSTADSPYVIGVLGDDPFGSVLDDIVRGDRIKGRPLVVRRVKRIEDAQHCHILFVSASEAGGVKDILRRLKGRPVLTVGDLPRFAEIGGAIGFTTEARVGLVVNPAALRDANLVVSSKLLRLAELVREATSTP